MNKSTYHLFFGNLSNPLRISIIASLNEKERSVTQLAEDLKVEQSKISHALASLKNCNIVNVKKVGKNKIYSLNKKTIIPMLELIDKHASKNCNCKSCNKECGR